MSGAVPAAKRVAKARSKQLADGWRRIPDMLPPDAVVALDALIDRGYADNATRVIARALVEAMRNDKAHAASNKR